MTPKKDKTWVYIDSFNLYYGALNKNRRVGLKWLDLQNWLSTIFPNNDIDKIKFFTARVSGKFNPQKPIRQEIYFRALKTLVNIEIFEGFFMFPRKRVHITSDVDIYARIPEEKGTDVNLAIHLVHDACKKEFDTAIVVSNDSDLAEAVRIVTKEIKLKVGVLNPFSTFSRTLVRHATFRNPVRETALLKCQFPATLTDKIGTFYKPPNW